MQTRILVLAATVAVALGLLGAVSALGVSEATAQPSVVLQPQPGAQPGVPAAAQPGAPRAGQTAPALPAGQPGAEAPRKDPEPPPHLDQIQSTGKGTALLFWAFALAAVGGALFVVTRRNLIAAVMGMVGSFLGIAAVYMMLYASFLSVVQMLVYAGAIMVLFVFVIMILNRPEDEPVAPSGRIGQLVGGAAMVYLVVRLSMILIGVKAPDASMGPPPPIAVNMSARQGAVPCDASLCRDRGGECVTVQTQPMPVCRVQHEWGTVKAVGTDLFGPGVFPFEAISILLLVAVVGAIAIARPLHEDDPPEADAATGAGGHS